MTAYRLTVCAFCLLLLFMVACCSHLAAPVTVPPGAQCPPHRLLLNAAASPAVPALKGIARIKVESPDESFSVKELIVAQRPGSMRLETLTPLGQPGFYAAIDGEDLFLFSPSENIYYHGRATPHNLGLILPMPLSLNMEQVISLILGSVVLIDYDADQLLCNVQEDGYLLRLRTRDENTTQVLTLSREDLRVVASETYGDGEELTLSVGYGGYEMVGGLNFPREITVSFPADRTMVRIHYKKIEFPADVDSSLFRLGVPQGAKIVPLE